MKSATDLAHGVVGILIVTMAVVANADTFYVNGSCGNDAWTGLSGVCAPPNGPKLTIQAGIDASVDGDEVIVADGTYMGVGNKNLDFGGRLITLQSENGPTACIIDCENDGRGVHFHSGETADAVLEGFTIRNGEGVNGGAILCESASPQIRNCTLLANTAIEFGGGLYAAGSSPVVTDCTFSGNSIAGLRFGYGGGGMYNSGSNPTVTNCTFSGNWLFGTAAGGGMYNVDSSPMVANCTFTNNTGFRGGGMYTFNGSPMVTNCTFSGNAADSSGGGMANKGGSPTVTNCAFTNNTGFAGGGMYTFNGSPMVTNCTFSGNSARWMGGGMYNTNFSSPTVTNCTFTNNTGEFGGGMITFGGSPTVSNCTFSGNSADSDGGGMYNFVSDTMVSNCTFSGNSASRWGGGMLNTGSSPTVTNCTFTNNTGEFGGGMNNRNASPTVTNCTFSGNSASSGGGMYNKFSSSNPTMTNCILWNDSPDEIVDREGAATTVSFSDVQGGRSGTGNIDLAPRFQNRSEGDFRLKPISPCIDAANNAAVPKGIETDLDGNPRFVDDPDTDDTGVPGNGHDEVVDMGAYEFQVDECDPCDMDCDGDINAFDIEPFLDLLFGPDPQFCNTCTGDANGDGNVDAFDIEPFLNCLFP